MTLKTHIAALVLWAVAALFALNGPPASAQEPASLLQQAAVAMENQDYAGAIKALEEYLPGNPEDFRAEFNLAYAYSMTGRRGDAIARYRSVVRQQPELVPAKLNLGILLVEEGQAAEAVEHLQFVAGKEPGDVRAAIYLARALAASGRIPEARDAYEKALQLKPDDAEAHIAYARLVAESDPALAERHLRRVLEIDLSREPWHKTLFRRAHAKMEHDPEVWQLVEKLIREAAAPESKNSN